MTCQIRLQCSTPDELAQLLADATRTASRDGTRVLVLTAAPGALDLPAPDDRVGWEREVWTPILKRMLSAEMIVLVLARGNISGLGLALCLAVDICVCDDQATFAAGQTGALSGGIGWHLHRLGGQKLAARLLLARQRLSADQATQAGIVTLTAPEPSMESEANALASPLHEDIAPLLLRSYRYARHLDLSEALDYDAQLAEVARDMGHGSLPQSP